MKLNTRRRRKAQLIEIVDKATLATREHVVLFTSRAIRGLNDALPPPPPPPEPKALSFSLGEKLAAALRGAA